jgi:hypothetical protein
MNAHSTDGERKFPVVSCQLGSNGDSGETGKYQGRKQDPVDVIDTGPHRTERWRRVY